MAATVEQLNEEQKAFYDMLPAKLKEAFLETVKIAEVGVRNKKRIEKILLNAEIAQRFGIILADYLRQTNDIITRLETDKDTSITNEEWTALETFPTLEDGYTLQVKRSRQTKAKDSQNEPQEGAGAGE